MRQLASILAAGFLVNLNLAPVDDAYKDSIAKWRAEVENDLKADRGWLSVAGLFWLKGGETTIGSDPTSGIVLPNGSAPKHVGVITLENGKVKIRVADGVLAKVNDQPISQLNLKSDADGSPDRVSIEALTIVVIKRGIRTGIRLFDSNSKGRKSFTGLKWYAIDPGYRIRAKYVAYDSPRQIPITNVLGDTQLSPNPGYLLFSVGGKKLRLEAQGGSSGLFINFKDLTNGKSTYAAGRFLDTEEPRDGFVILDFNRAYNPPCAFTDFATCPLPPKANHLPLSIPAGEKNYGHS